MSDFIILKGWLQKQNVTNSVGCAQGVVSVPFILNGANLPSLDSVMVFLLGFVGIFYQSGNVFAVDLHGHFICYS